LILTNSSVMEKLKFVKITTTRTEVHYETCGNMLCEYCEYHQQTLGTLFISGYQQKMIGPYQAIVPIGKRMYTNLN
jgi:hypothetical protein